MWAFVNKLSYLRQMRLSVVWARRLALVLALAGATAGAFYWGRSGAPQAVAQLPKPGELPKSVVQSAVPQAPKSDYERRVVAYIYDNVPITREDLGEYLIARFGAERVEFLVNRRIVEIECQKRGIYATDAEVLAQFQEDLKSFGTHMTAKDFELNILKRFNKTLYEWKEDVIRPKLLLAKLARPLVKVEEKEIKDAFDARHGPRVQCRWIVLAKDNKQMFQIWERVSKSEDEFKNFASQQFITQLAAKGGEAPPIHMHFPEPELEREAFALQPGQVSRLMQMKDGSHVILKCDKHVPADATKRLQDERDQITRELAEVKLAQKIPEVFNELKKQANPKIILTNRVHQEELERAALKELGAAPQPKLAAPMGN